MTPRIAICGIHIESSTFAPQVATAQDFTVLRGHDLLARYPWLVSESGRPWAHDVEWVPILFAGAMPGGAVVADAYRGWRDEIVAGLGQAGRLDGLYFDIHGAMSVVGMDDAEGDLADAVRGAVGPDVLISATMDLHGNVSPTLFAACDLLTCYRMAPHEDAWESRERAARNLCERVLAGEPAPHKALVSVPILLPGEKTSTRVEPARSLYAKVPEVEARDGILDAGVWIGYAWADEPRCCGAVVVTGDDESEVVREARELAAEFWRVRDQFEFVGPVATFDEALAAARASQARPFVISDSGDNPGAGGADDTTYALSRILAAPEVKDGSLTVIVASIHDPAAVRQAVAAGTGATITVEVGGHIDSRPPGPLTVTADVAALADDPRGGPTAVLRIGGAHVVVTTHRNQYAELEQYHRLGLSPAEADVVVVKIGYLEPDLWELAADWILALTPGGVDQDLARLGHHRIQRPMFPFDRVFDVALEVLR